MAYPHIYNPLEYKSSKMGYLRNFEESFNRLSNLLNEPSKYSFNKQSPQFKSRFSELGGIPSELDKENRFYRQNLENSPKIIADSANLKRLSLANKKKMLDVLTKGLEEIRSSNKNLEEYGKEFLMRKKELSRLSDNLHSVKNQQREPFKLLNNPDSVQNQHSQRRKSMMVHKNVENIDHAPIMREKSPKANSLGFEDIAPTSIPKFPVPPRKQSERRKSMMAHKNLGKVLTKTPELHCFEDLDISPILGPNDPVPPKKLTESTKRKAIMTIRNHENYQTSTAIKNKPSKNPGLSLQKKVVGRSRSIALESLKRRMSFAEEKLPDDVENIDKNKDMDQANCDAYAEDIINYMLKLEKNENLKANSNYLKEAQKFITHEMREIVIDWLLDVQHHLDLSQETFYKAIILMDRYLKAKEVLTKNVQLVGLTCLLISSKYVEIIPPEVDDLVELSDGIYTKEDILKTERSILSEVRFNLTMVDHSFYVSRLMMASNLSIIDKFDRRIVKVASYYFLDSMMPYIETLKYSPSKLAASAVLLARYLVFHHKPHRYGNKYWSSTLQYYSRYKKLQLMPIIKKIANVRCNLYKSHLKALQTKYNCKEKYKSICNSVLMNKTNFEAIAYHGF